MLPANWINCPYFVGMSFREKCVGSLQRQNTEILEWCIWVSLFFPLPIGKALKIGTWTVGCDKLGNMERSKQVLFWKVQIHPKNILAGAIGFLGEYQRLVVAQTNRHQWGTLHMLLLQAHDTHGAGFFLFLSMPMGLVTYQDSSVLFRSLFTVIYGPCILFTLIKFYL